MVLLAFPSQEKQERKMLKRLMVVLLVAGVSGTVAFGQLQFFDDRGAFGAYNQSQGRVMEGLEDFEENNLPPNDVSVQNEPLDWNPNVNFPNGLTGLTHMQITSSGGGGVVLLTDGFFGAQTSIVGANTFADTTILHFVEPDHRSIGLDLVDLINGGMSDIEIFDTNHQSLGSTTWSSPFTPVFFGVFSPDDDIGWIEITGQNAGGELVDNVEAWIPEPGTLSLLGLAGLVLLRRRS